MSWFWHKREKPPESDSLFGSSTSTLFATTPTTTKSSNFHDWLQKVSADPLLRIWNLSWLGTLILPLFFFTVARLGGEGRGDGNDANDDGRNHWWQFWIKREDDNRGAPWWWPWRKQENNGENHAPWWWIWQDDRDQEGQSGTGTLVFVYLWTVFLLLATGICGNRMITLGNNNTLFWFLLAFANYAFIVMVLLGGLDGVKVDAEEIEGTGWYGQTSVLLFMTCFFGFLMSLVFALWLRRRSKRARSWAGEMEPQDDGFVNIDEACCGAI